jgi:hypothetical protein
MIVKAYQLIQTEVEPGQPLNHGQGQEFQDKQEEAISAVPVKQK